jgi:hypothetical protein
LEKLCYHNESLSPVSHCVKGLTAYACGQFQVFQGDMVKNLNGIIMIANAHAEGQILRGEPSRS